MKFIQHPFLIFSAMSLLLAATAGNAEITVRVVNIDNQPVTDIVVYLLPLENQKLDNASTPPVVVYQSKKRFSPYISVLQKDSVLTFSNKDNITHQIYSTSSSNRFSFRLKSGTHKTIEQISTTGKVLMGCNIHDWMSGYLMIVDTPLYAKTNIHGESTFKTPQSGRYQLIAWHPQLKEKDQQISREITMNDGQLYAITLTEKMAEIPDQKNVESFNFLEGY